MSQGLRRYPALAFMALAAVLASLLPSTLRIPLSGPSSAAELAPVPGRSDASTGDMSAVGESTTDGLGAGSGTGPGGGGGGGGVGELDGTPGGPGGRGDNPRNKRCVGKPPRQTDDPLSPVCVAFFEGDNGGATAKGVTADEIRIVFENCKYSSGSDVHVDYWRDDSEQDRRYVAYQSHFTNRFQLFNRRAHFFEIRWADCSLDPTVRRAQVQRLNERYDPFAILSQRGALTSRDAADEAARLGIVTQLDAPERSFTQRRAPYVYSVPPDLEDHMTIAAEFICQRLAGRPARHSGEVQDHGRTRSFGISYDMPNDPDRAGPRLLVDEVRRRCHAPIAEYAGDASDAIPRMRLDGVTTVVKFGLNREDTLVADAAGWHPEWAVLDSQYTAQNGAQQPPAQWRNAFGFTFDRRLGVEETHASYVAAEDGCAGCGPHADDSSYDAVLLLFWGIQSAGPRLTPPNFERGLRSLPQRRSEDPFLPAAYLAPGNHSWIKDAAAIWWDPSGRPPGWAHVGCFRLIEGGLRYRADDWRTRPGDDGIKRQDTAGQPCQGLS